MPAKPLSSYLPLWGSGAAKPAPEYQPPAPPAAAWQGSGGPITRPMFGPIAAPWDFTRQRPDLPPSTPRMSAPPPWVPYDASSPTGTWQVPQVNAFVQMGPNPFATAYPTTGPTGTVPRGNRPAMPRIYAG